MAAISITAANVIKSTGAMVETGISGATITAGQLVYKKASDSKFYLADGDSVSVAADAEVDNVHGIALHGASASQPLTVQKSGNITIGGTVAVGEVYALDCVAGGIIPESEIATTDYVTLVGIGVSATVIKMAINVTDTAHA